MKSNQEKKKFFARESEKTWRAREKLKAKLQNIEQQVTQEGLDEKIQEIRRWIARHAPRRVVLKDKKISLFDGNQRAFKLSKRVEYVLDRVKKENFFFSGSKNQISQEDENV